MTDKRNEAPTAKMVSQWALARGSFLPNNPTTTAAMSGSKGMARYICCMVIIEYLAFQAIQIVYVNGT